MMTALFAETDLAKDSTEKSQRAGAPKAQRKPLTIDLPAEEVERKTVEASVPDAPAEPEGAAADAGAAGGANVGAPSETPPDPTETETAAEERRAQEMEEHTAEDQPEASPSARATPAAPSPKQGESSVAFVPLLVAAILGGVVVALVVVLMARGGFFLPPPDTQVADLQTEMTAIKDDVAALKQAGTEDRLTPLRDEMATLKQSVAALEDREPVPASNAAEITDIEGRLAALSGDVDALKSTAPGDSSAVAGEVASLRQKVDALSAKFANAPDDARISALEAKLDAANAKIDKAAGLAPAVAADALAAALAAGRPFEAELAALRALDVDAARLDALAPHAASGLPTLAGLRATFESEIATVDLAEPIPEGTGVMDRLVRSARGLVDVRPAHPTEGADPAAVVARIRAALEAGDLKTALAERESLPDTVKAATADFARDAEARQSAEDLVATLRADALSRLETGH